MAKEPASGEDVQRSDGTGPLARREPETLVPAGERRSILARIGLGGEPSGRAKYLRAILAGLKEAASAQIEQIPGIGPAYKGLVEALLQLSEEEGSEAFEAKIEKLLTVGEQSREDLEALSALATAIFLQQGAILHHLEGAGLPTAPRQLTDVALSTAWTAYLGRVARDYQYADYRGIEGGTRAEHAAALPLDDVYVLPRLIPEREQADVRDRERTLLKELLDNQDLPSAERARMEEEYSVLTGERWRAARKKAEEKEPGQSLGEALAQTRHAVVIGGPGTGKSTLTRYLARACALGEEVTQSRLGWAEPLTPVVLPLAAYADARQKRGDLLLREFLDQQMKVRGGDALQAAIAAELTAGRVILLFDGVDEIPDSRDRITIVKAVERFIADHPTNRIIVTSRPDGYVRLAGEIPHFQLPNFSQEQVRLFLRQWQLAFERWRHPEAPDLAQAEKEAREMVSVYQWWRSFRKVFLGHTSALDSWLSGKSAPLTLRTP